VRGEIMEMFGFKEWALICGALGAGRQSLILRKGGIAEGRAGFRFSHDRFLLVPTLFHEQAEKLTVPADTVLPQADPRGHVMRYLAEVCWTEDVVDWERVRGLEGFHLWTEQTLWERFIYDERRSISLAFVRVHRLEEPVVLPDSPKFGGCKSWVNLGEVELSRFVSVIGDEEHSLREQRVRSVLA
jgi:hypothetical protein